MREGYVTPEMASSTMALSDDSREMRDLLSKTRLVGRAMQGRRENSKPDYTRLARLLGEFSTANVYVISRDGQVLGYSWMNEYHSATLQPYIDKGFMPESFVELMNQQRETVMSKADAYLFDDRNRVAEDEPEKLALYVPIYGSAERLGTLVLSRFSDGFSTQDLVLAEYLATLVGIEILHDRTRVIEERARERLVVQMAMRALSYSEVESVKHIISELNGYEGVVIASRIADRVGVTRSVIVNALRKLESAGIIESRSLGMKGTHIRILSSFFVDELGIRFTQS